MEQVSEQNQYFDIKHFFQSESDRIVGTQFTKQLVLNGELETVQIDRTGIINDLKVFESADINKSAWVDKYQVDSTFSSGSLTKVQYSGLDDKLQVKNIEIQFTDSTPRSIRILKSTKNLVYTSEQVLDYTTDSLYQIKSLQKALFLPGTLSEVKVKFF